MIKLVQMCMDLPEYENRIINVIKAKYGFNTKQDATLFIVRQYGEKILEEKFLPEEPKEKVKEPVQSS